MVSLDFKTRIQAIQNIFFKPDRMGSFTYQMIQCEFLQQKILKSANKNVYKNPEKAEKNFELAHMLATIQTEGKDTYHEYKDIERKKGGIK